MIKIRIGPFPGLENPTVFMGFGREWHKIITDGDQFKGRGESPGPAAVFEYRLNRGGLWNLRVELVQGFLLFSLNVSIYPACQRANEKKNGGGQENDSRIQADKIQPIVEFNECEPSIEPHNGKYSHPTQNEPAFPWDRWFIQDSDLSPGQDDKGVCIGKIIHIESDFVMESFELIGIICPVKPNYFEFPLFLLKRFDMDAFLGELDHKCLIVGGEVKCPA